jgi:hypothetical protein
VGSIKVTNSLTSREAKAFVALCRAGKLYEIEAWINSGKPLHHPEEFRGSTAAPKAMPIGLAT